MRSVLVTLCEGAQPEESQQLREEIQKWKGVVQTGRITSDEHVPSYFFVYAATDADLEEIVSRLNQSTIVRQAKIPPARYAIS